MPLDNVTIERIKLLHPAVRNEAMEIYEEINRALTGKAIARFTHTLRTIKEQDALYAKGRTAPGPIVTKAKGGMSYHNYGLAIDMVLIVNGKEVSYDTLKDYDGDKVADWMECVNIFKSYGWEWGGDWKFKDMPHFQKTAGFSVQALKIKYDQKAFVPGTEYVLI